MEGSSLDGGLPHTSSLGVKIEYGLPDNGLAGGLTSYREGRVRDGELSSLQFSSSSSSELIKGDLR